MNVTFVVTTGKTHCVVPLHMQSFLFCITGTVLVLSHWCITDLQ